MTEPVCSQCRERPAVCFGAYEDHRAYGYACDTCCGHGNEDGFCDMLSEHDRDEWPERLAFDAGFAAEAPRPSPDTGVPE